MATGFNRLGASAYTSAPSAIVQQAKKDWKYYQNAIISAENSIGALLKEYKEGGTWKEFYKTWTDACVPLNLSRRHVNRLIQEESGTSMSQSDSGFKLESLKTVSKLPDPTKEEEPEKPRVKTATEVMEENAGLVAPPTKNGHTDVALDLPHWTSKVLKLFDVFPKSKLYNKLTPEAIKTFESSLASLYSVLGDFLPQKPAKILCKCGCGLSAEVSERLFAVGVPCMGLTVGQAGLVMKKMSENEWKLPRYFAFLKNEGEWKERQWRK